MNFVCDEVWYHGMYIDRKIEVKLETSRKVML